MQKWEYVSVLIFRETRTEQPGDQLVEGWLEQGDDELRDAPDDILGDYGEDGWELVNLVPDSLHQRSASFQVMAINVDIHRATFKRLKQ